MVGLIKYEDIDIIPLEMPKGLIFSFNTMSLGVGATGILKSSKKEWKVTKKDGEFVTVIYKGERQEYKIKEFDLVKESKDVVNNYTYESIETPKKTVPTDGFGHASDISPQGPNVVHHGYYGDDDDDLDGVY